MLRSLVLAAALFLGTDAAQAQTLTKTQIADLKQVMLNSIDTKHAPDGDSGFDGSYDWHSDVHGHWALLSIARVTNDADLETKMLSILSMDRLELEYKFLMDQDRQWFEKPYGRTWYLLLLWELNQRPQIAKQQRFQKMRSDLSKQMLDWLKTSSFPEWDTRLIGTHDSWLMSLFLFDTAKSGNTKVKKEVRELIQNKMLPLAEQIEKHEMERDDFLYLPALKYLIHPDHRYSNPYLPLPTSTEFACHYPGAVQVSLWAYSAQCARKDAEACTEVRKASQEFYKQTMLWKDDFRCVSHWVPQFTWMTHWLSSGKL